MESEIDETGKQKLTGEHLTYLKQRLIAKMEVSAT